MSVGLKSVNQQLWFDPCMGINVAKTGESGAMRVPQTSAQHSDKEMRRGRRI